jgi:hypothetical protein
LARAADLPKAVFDLTAVDEIVGFSSLRWTAGPVSKTSPPPHLLAIFVFIDFA